MTTLDVLMTARKLLSNPKRWTKGTLVKPNADGEQCYCALGALLASCGFHSNGYEFDLPDEFYSTEGGQTYNAASNRLMDSLPDRFKGRWVPGFNDNSATTHTDVMQAFSDAIDAEIAASGQERAQVPAVTS